MDRGDEILDGRAGGRRSLRLAASNAAVPAPPDLSRFDLPAPFAQLRDYWSGLRVGNALPRRADIAPREIADLLDSTLLIERMAPGLARVRVAGMRLSDLLGMDLRGMPLSALIVPADRDAFAEELEVTFARPAQVEIWLRSDWGIGRPSLDARMIFLPVLGDRGHVDRALGHVILSGDVGRAPRRFSLRGAVDLPIRPAAGITPAPEAPRARRSLPPGLAEPGAMAQYSSAPTHHPQTMMPAGADPLAILAAKDRSAPLARRSHLRLVARSDD